MDRTWKCLLIPGLLAVALPAATAPREAPLPAILVSRQLAESRGLHVGDIVHLSVARTDADAKEFRVAGIYEPTPDPMRFAERRLEVRMHLPDLITLTPERTDDTSDSITSINVALHHPSAAAAFSRDVTAWLPTLTARPTTAPDERSTTFLVLDRFHLAIAIVTVLGSAVFLLALMVMVVDERRATVGTLRLIGFTRRRILAQVMAEGALIALAGALGGLAFAFLTQGMFNRFFQWRYDTTLVFLRLTWSVAARSLLIAVPLGLLASLIASWTLLRQQILSLVRR